MAVGDVMPYGLRIAHVEGAIGKPITHIYIAPVQGSINKEITDIFIAPVQGAINKRIYVGGGILGDVNGDGVVNVTDILWISAHMNGTQPLTAEEFYRADVNGDGVVNDTDKQLIEEYILAG